MSRHPPVGDDSGAAPLYLQLAQSIRDQIARGELRPGDSLPTVRELARQLGINQNTVNRAYGVLKGEGILDARSSQGTRVSAHAHAEQLQTTREAELHKLTTRLISEAVARGFSLAEVEASFLTQRTRWQEQAAQQVDRRLRPNIVGLGSHDLSLELLLAQLRHRHPELQIQFGAIGSLPGLLALARGQAHFAATHLYDPTADEYNLPFVQRLLGGQAVVLITLAQRTQGLMLAKGNPKHIHSVRDLTRRGIRLVNRQRGSGTRVLLNELLRKARIPQRQVQGYADEERTHLAVAAAVASGAADAGFGIEAAARSFGLDFVPLAHERYELVLARTDPLKTMFLDQLGREEFQQAVRALGGYDLSETGRVRTA